MTQEIKPIIKLVALYTRVSTGRQENEQTVKNQLMVLHDFAEKNGYTIIKEYTDEGWSGDRLDRPALDQLRVAAKEKKWEAVIIYDPDRLARRYSYQELLIDELTERGIEVIFITIPTPKNEDEKLMGGVRGLFAQYERAKITERFRLGKLRSAKEGNLVTSRAPYGYKYILKKDKVRGHYEINPQEAEVVKMIFTWIADEDVTIRGVIKKLQALKIPPQSSKRGVWSTSTMCRLLKNRTYVGEAIYLRSYAVEPKKPLKNEAYKKCKKSSRKNRPEEEWIKITVPWIIEKDLFEKVQRQLKLNSLMNKRNKKNQYLLSGKILCTCGRHRVGEGPQHGKHLYYRCSDRAHSFPLPPKCLEKGINARISDELVWKRLKTLMCSPEQIMREAKKWDSKKNTKTEVSGDAVGELKKEITKLKDTEKRYVTAFGAGVLSMDQLKEYTNDVKKKIFTIQSQISYLEEQMKQPADVTMPNINEINKFCQDYQNMLEYLSFEEKQKIIQSIITKVVANKDMVSVDGFLSIPDNNYVFRSICRNRRSAKCWQVNAV